MCHASSLALQVVTLSSAAVTFQVDVPAMGGVVTAFVVGMAASSVPAGLIGDRIGTARVLSAFFWLLGLGGIACSLAPTYPLFLAAHTLLGVAAGLFHPAGLGLLSFTYPAARLGRAMGTFGVAAGVGQALTPLVMSMAFGWRAGFLVLGALGIAGAVSSHLLRAGGLVVDAPPPPDLSVERYGGHGVRRGLVLLLVAMGGSAFLAKGFETVFPEVIASEGVALPATGSMMAVLAVGGAAQWIGGLLAGGPLAAPRYALLIVLQPLALLAAAHAVGFTNWSMLSMATFAALNYATIPIENKLLATYTSTRRRSTAYALKFLVALLVAAPAPTLVAWLYGRSGDHAEAFRALAVCAVVAVAAAYFFLRSMHRRPRRAEA